MIDDVFGELNYDFIWEGQTKISLFEEIYDVNIGIEGEEGKEITELQKESFLHFINNENDIIKKVESVIFEYYKKIFEFEPERMDYDVVRKLPQIKNQIEMKRLVKPIQVCIPELDENIEISILFDCEWDFDLGMGVKIVNDEVVRIGVQNDVL